MSRILGPLTMIHQGAAPNRTFDKTFRAEL